MLLNQYGKQSITVLKTKVVNNCDKKCKINCKKIKWLMKLKNELPYEDLYSIFHFVHTSLRLIPFHNIMKVYTFIFKYCTRNWKDWFLKI